MLEGANGSGKSTLLALVAQLLRPSRGELRYEAEGGALQGESLRAQIGYGGHAALVYPDLSACDNLRFMARRFALVKGEERVQEVGQRLGLLPFWQRPVRTYSQGQLQRTALARALLHRPSLLVLDEPTTALDARSTERVAELLLEERARGALILLSTHDHPLAAKLADQRIVLRAGRRVSETEARGAA